MAPSSTQRGRREAGFAGGGDLRAARLLVLLLATLLAVASVARAQQFNFTAYDVVDGLPAGPYLSLFQDREGYLWAGTVAGVARYDGASFEVFTTDRGLSGNTVVDIAQDEQGRLLFATETAGVSVYDGESFTAYRAPEPLPSDRVTDLWVDPDGVVWVGTDSGLARIDGERSARFDRSDGLPHPGVRAVVRDRAGRLWVGTRGGLAWLRGGRFVAMDSGLPERIDVRAIAEDASGRIWIGSRSGLFRGRSGSFEPVAISDGGISAARSIRAIVADDRGELWIATGAGVLHVDGSDVRRITEANGLLDDDVRAVLTDREETVWFAGRRGVSKLVPGVFITFTPADGLPDQMVLGLAGNGSGDVWITTPAGVAVMGRDGGIRLVAAIEALGGREPTAAIPLEDGGALIGTGSGLVVWDGGVVAVHGVAEGLPASGVTSLARGPEGSIWVGTEGGLARWRPGGVEPPGDGLPDARIVDLETDGRGRLWIATGERGPYRRDGEIVREMGRRIGLGEVGVWGLAAAPDGGVWIGTNGRGAFLVRPDDSVLHLSARNGLVTDFVFQILVDGAGRTWFYTNRGLDRWDPSVGFTHFGRAAGLVDLQGIPDAAFRDARGRLWFGTAAGLVHYEPGAGDGAPRAESAPHVRIRRMTAGNEPVELDGAIRLSPIRKNVTISYVALTFRNEASVRYRYRLLGLDPVWSSLTPERMISYASLAPGTYTFEVEAISGDGQWSDEPARITFTVEPAIHQRIWFQLLVAGVVIALGLIAYARRVGRVESERKRLAAMVEKRTRELVEKNEQLEQMATTDELTGLRNRRFFLEALEMELRKLARAPEEEALALLIIDLDDFKSVNDRFGHAVGDDVLQQVARRLEEGVRASDIVARYGGEEFAILLPNTTRSGAEYLGDKLRDDVESATLYTNGEVTRLTASIGVATTSPPERYTPELAEDLLRRADEAMYRAKAAGKNRVVVADQRRGVGGEERPGGEASVSRRGENDRESS